MNAWVNRIDFASKEDGKPTVTIGTTKPVDFQLTEISDKRLRLDLLDTNLPEYRNRALITTRFQSAVDLQHFKKLVEALSDPNFFSSLAGLIPRYCIATFFQRKRQHANARQNI